MAAMAMDAADAPCGRTTPWHAAAQSSPCPRRSNVVSELPVALPPWATIMITRRFSKLAPLRRLRQLQGTLLPSAGFALAAAASSGSSGSSAATADLRYLSQPASDAAGQAIEPHSFPVGLYPEIEPYAHGHLAVGDGHEVYWEQCGNPDGVPAIFLHGGPGGGCDERSRRFFDPAVYRIVCLDQRGSGRSHPNAADDWEAAIVGNTTANLVADITAVKEELGIQKWGLVLGGSWGSTLALAYAQAEPAAVKNIVLRGVFLFGPDEVDYLFSNGGTYGQVCPSVYQLHAPLPS